MKLDKNDATKTKQFLSIAQLSNKNKKHKEEFRLNKLSHSL